MPLDPTLPLLLWCTLALFAGGIIKGALGVGTPLLTVPLMALVLPPQTAIAIMAFPVVMANLWQVAQTPKTTHIIRRFWPTLTALLAGTCLGIIILTRINERALLIIVGISVIAFALLQTTSRRLHIPPKAEKPAGIAFGLTSGIIGGISSFFGPMLIIYLTALNTLTKNQFIGAISFLYAGAVIPWAITLYLIDILTPPLLLYSTAATAPVALGMLLGRRIHHHISETRFQHLITLILLTSGTTILWRVAA